MQQLENRAKYAQILAKFCITLIYTSIVILPLFLKGQPSC